MQTEINETGRSMVEMLGVLAIIGILSIGGIQGYTYAMNKYRANNVLNEMNIASLHLTTTLLSSRNTPKMIALGEPYDSGELANTGYSFDYGCGNDGTPERACQQDEQGYWVAIGDVPEKICQNILSEAKHLPNIVEQRLNDVAIEDGSACAENNEIMLLFNADGSGEFDENYGEGNQEDPEEPEVTDNCPANTSVNGKGGFAKTLIDETTGEEIQCYCKDINTKYTDSETCETLPEKCSKNTDCNRGYFCNISDPGSNSCTTNMTGMTGSCTEVKLRSPNENKTPPFVMSDFGMTWWAAKNFCEALGKTLVDVNDYGCTTSFTDGKAKNGWCHSSVTQLKAYKIMQMEEAYMSNTQPWTNTSYDNCKAYTVLFGGGPSGNYDNVRGLDRTYTLGAVCK